MAFGLTTAVLAALVASATLLPPPTATATPGTRLRAADRPGRADTEARLDAHQRSAGADHRAYPLGPHLSHRAAGRQQGDQRCWTRHGPCTPATSGTTTLTEAFSTFGATTQPPVTASTTTAAPTTTAASTTTLATTTSTEPTSGPTTTSAEPTTTTGAAIP